MIVRFDGRLGNQIFQFAFYIRLRSAFPQYRIKMDPWGLKDKHLNMLDAFDVDIPICTEREHHKNIRSLRFIPSRIQHPLGWPKYSSEVVTDEKYNGRDIENDIGSLKESAFLVGYWQSEAFFEPVSSEVLRLLRFKKVDDFENKSIINRIENTYSVAVHVRRTDYLDVEEKGYYADLSSSNYYINAFNYILQQRSDASFFVFSDDLEWCKDHFDLDNMFFVECNRDEAWKDMYLISLCDRCIIANSSFSWWGAYLNKKQDVIVPDYIGERQIKWPDYYPGRWNRISIR